MSEKGLRPLKSYDRNSTGEHYWMCPSCHNWVGGFVITGMAYDNMRYHEDKFCQKCSTKINWKR